MNKRGLIILGFAVAFVLLFSSFALAAENDSAADNAYKCLESQIKNKTLSLKEAVFSTLALGSKSGLVDRIEADKDASSCWPKSACKIKETAQVALAYNRIGKDTSEIRKWLSSKNFTAPELKWLLQIDITNKVAASCTIKDGQKTTTIKVLEDSKLQGSAGSCFTLDNDGYMLKINSNCLKNTFEISCDQDFVTSVLYQRTTGGTLFVLPETHSAASLGSTKEKVSGDCFRTESTCDYEGTLWAALALQKMGTDVSRYIPYLLALSGDNSRYFPSSFLYILVGGDDQYNQIIQNQKQGKFWEIAGTRDGRYYDTSLALLSLGENGGAEVDAAKSYLLEIQTKDGCWNNNNIRDTAFLLYAGWSRAAAGFGSISSPPSCEPQFSCENSFDCTQGGGIIEYSYECPTFGQSCCSIKIAEPSCSEKKGLLCPYGTECAGRSESSSDGPCCLDGACTEVPAGTEDTCTPAGGTCRAACESGEEQSYLETCSLAGDVCCISSGTSAWFWIILLLILIVIVVLAIVFREKVKIWWFKMKSKFKKKPVAQPVPQQRPGAPFAPLTRPMMPQTRTMIVPQRPQIRPYPKDKEMEEALRRLREMSKK